MSEKNKNSAIDKVSGNSLYTDVCDLIEKSRHRAATFLNTEICMTNYHIGKRIKEDVLYNQRAEYGKQVVKKLAIALTERYGAGWSDKKLRHCIPRCGDFL